MHRLDDPYHERHLGLRAWGGQRRKLRLRILNLAAVLILQPCQRNPRSVLLQLKHQRRHLWIHPPCALAVLVSSDRER
jgi:hypothetical protein